MMAIDKVYSNSEIDIMMNTALLKGSAPSVLMRVLSASAYEIAEFSKDDVVSENDIYNKSLAIVLSGRIIVSIDNADGNNVFMRTVGVGEILGEAGLFGEQIDYCAKLTAAEECRLIFFSQKTLVRMFERDAGIAKNYITFLSDRIRFLNSKVYFFTAGTAEQRLASFLMDNLSQHDYQPLPMSMIQVASSLNISRASLYRALDAIISGGAVMKKGRLMIIADEKKLCEYIV